MVEEKIITKEYLKKVDKEIEMIPLTFDIVFKAVFERNLNILKRFLISIFELKLKPDDTKIELSNTELLKENVKEYQKRVDIIAILNDTIFIEIEINRGSFNNVKLRNNLYFDKLYSTLLETGENPNILPNIYLYQLNLNIEDKSITYGEDIIVWYSLVTKDIFIKTKRIVLEYLEFFRRMYYTNFESLTDTQIWLASLTANNFTELNEMLSHILTDEERTKLLKEAIRMSRLNFNLHEWEKEKMDELVKAETARINKEDKEKAIEESFMQGIEQGIEKGIEKGIEQGIKDTITNMLKKKMNLQDISDITGKTVDEIKEIANFIKE